MVPYTYPSVVFEQTYPETFTDLLQAPCRVINLDRNPERWEKGLERIQAAGFQNIQRVSAVDAKDPSQLTEVWKMLGNPSFATWDTEFVKYPGKQGCFLSHIKLWKEMIDHKIPYMVVLEDDVLFHPLWDKIATKYFENTPKDYDIFYLGAQFEFQSNFHIDCGPVFCTHAMVLTYTGVKKLWDMIFTLPKGVYTIDCMIIDMMKYKLMHSDNMRSHPFTWYVWNGRNFYPTELQEMPKGWTKRNCGLVFQDESFGSEVREW